VFIDGRARQVAGFAREPSDSQIDGDYGLAAKGRQLERARSCRCDVGVSVKEVSVARLSSTADLIFSQNHTRVVIGWQALGSGRQPYVTTILGLGVFALT
jgi:hypothetical protein